MSGASEGATLAIAAATTLGVVVRPWRLPEATWAVLGAGALVGLALVPSGHAFAAILKGTDVYLFLLGMMLLSETARAEGLFAWLAAAALALARGSALRLFGLVYAVGAVVTIFLSNDATAVVLTPAVYAATQAAKAEPMPYLLICAFVANAASFVLPVSNPANLVVFGAHMPPLLSWVAQFGLASVVSIGVTYAALLLTQRGFLRQPIARRRAMPHLTIGSRWAAGGLAVTAVALMLASAFDVPLGLPTVVAGIATTTVVLITTRKAPWAVARGIGWDVFPLVGGLFVLVEALEQIGILTALRHLLERAATEHPNAAAWGAGAIIAVMSNVMNNLPVGLIAGSVVGAADLPPQVTGALLIGVDLGPNLSVTGSLATILWLVAIRREGLDIGAGRFLQTGLVVMVPALALAIGCYLAGA